MIRFRAASAQDLIDKAREIAPGMEMVEMYRRAAVVADRQGDLDSAFEARSELIDATYYASAKLDQLVAFAYCLNAADRHPDRFSAEQLMWRYKWVIENMIEFTPVPVEGLERMLDDLGERYRRHGLGTAAVDQLRLSLYVATGKRERLHEAFRAWDENTDDAGADCAACQQHVRVRYHATAGEDEAAVEAAQPLTSGRMRCGEVPHITYGLLHMPLLRLERFDDAARGLLRGYNLIRQREGFVHPVGDHLVFLAIAGDVDRGFALVQYHLREALATHCDVDRITFNRGAWAVCERAMIEGRTVVDLSLSPRFPLFEADGVYDVRDLSAWFQRQCESATAAFDARNGNTAQADATAEVFDKLKRRWRIPLDEA